MAKKTEKFGALIGVAPGGVPAFSSDYDSADPVEFPSRRSYMSHHEGVYTGYRYQCVEFARRWLVAVHRVTFPDVHMAYDIFDLPAAKCVDSGEPVAMHRVANGSGGERPMQGSLLIWFEGGYFKHTGHVAVVTDATDSYVRVAEQNVYDAQWGEGKDFSRELRAGPPPPELVAAGKAVKDGYYVYDNHRNTHVLGWVTVERVREHHRQQLRIQSLQNAATGGKHSSQSDAAKESADK